MADRRTPIWIWLALSCAWPATAADPPAAAGRGTTVEGVTVQASKKPLDRQVQDYVGTADVPSRIGQLPRWNDKICPLTVGMSPEYNAFVSNRVLELAARVKAPVGKAGACTTNLVILFTPQPQAILDKVLKDKPWALGAHYTQGEARALATVKHPIQAWYATATQDLNGRVIPDDPEADWQATSDPDEIVANATHAEGSRLRLGLMSQFASVLVVADSTKVAGRQLGALSDYIAMLALTQSKSLDGCRDLPTITNLFATDCAGAGTASEATAADLAYLRTLYSTSGGLIGAVQQGAIMSEMRRALKTK